MKNTIIFAFLSIIFLGACKLDDGGEISTYDFLAGPWSLVNVSGGIAGVDDDFAPGVITWTFHAVNKTVVVQNDNELPVLMDILATGTYPFDIVKGTEHEELVVDGINFGVIDCVDQRVIHIDQRVSDGVVITFSRMSGS